MSAVQLGLPTMESCERSFKRVWKPCLSTLASLQEYFAGYVRNGRNVFAGLEYIRARLGMSKRNLARYLGYLRDNGWLETIRQGRRAAVRKLTSVFSWCVLSSGTSKPSVPLYDGKAEVRTRAAEKQPSRKAPKRVEPDWDAMDRADIETYRRIKLPRRHWPVHLQEFAEVA